MDDFKGPVDPDAKALNVAQLLRENPSFPIIGLSREVAAVRSLGRVAVRGVLAEVALWHDLTAVGNRPSAGLLETSVLKTSTLYVKQENDAVDFVLRTQWRSLKHVHRLDDTRLVESETTVSLNNAPRPAAMLSGSRAGVGVVVVSPEYLLRLTWIERSDVGALPLTRLSGVQEYPASR